MWFNRSGNHEQPTKMGASLAHIPRPNPKEMQVIKDADHFSLFSHLNQAPLVFCVPDGWVAITPANLAGAF